VRMRIKIPVGLDSKIASGLSIKGRVGLCILLIAFCLCAACGKASGPIKADASEGVCPVCRMDVKATDPATSEIVYSDGTKLMFETAGDMLTFYNEPEKYEVTEAQKDRGKIERILIKDYNSKAEIDARRVTLVYKSRVNGPMGPDVFAFQSQDEASSFVKTNGGSLLTFNDLTPEMVRNLRKK
jgi:nitrous oxide reductase accessory protein NosL